MDKRETRELSDQKVQSHFGPILVPEQNKFVQIVPKVDINYDADTIEYMTSPSRARSIRDIFLQNWQVFFLW